MKRIMIPVMAIMLLPLCSAAQSKRAFTIPDLYKLTYMQQLSLSPDGTEVLFTVTGSDLETGTHTSHIWLLNRTTGKLIQLTRGDDRESSPRWSESGGNIYFLSNRKEANQVWQLHREGSDPIQLTSVSSGINQYRISPLDQTIFYSSDVYPECGADDDCNSRTETQRADGPTQAHYATDLLYRHWNAYRDGRYEHLFHLNNTTEKTEALTQGEQDFPNYGGTFVLSPDGTELCLTVNPDKAKAESTNSDLVLINLKTGKQRNITRANEAYDGDPAYSPDGRYIAYRLQKIPGYESDRFRLAVFDRTTGRTTFLTERVQNWVQSFEWSPDSKELYFTVPEAGYTTLYNVRLSDDRSRPPSKDMSSANSKWPRTVRLFLSGHPLENPMKSGNTVRLLTGDPVN